MDKRVCYIAAVLALAACGDDGDDASTFVGLYEVTHHTRNETACDQEGPASDDFTHFALTEGDLFGQSYLSFGECTSADPASCQNLGIFSAYIRFGGAWTNELHSSSGGGDASCFLGYVHGTMTKLDEPGELRFETRVYNEEDDTLSEEECDPDTAEARGDDMPCELFEVVEGVFSAELPPAQ